MKRSMMLVGLMMVSTVIFSQKYKPDPVAVTTKRSDKMKAELTLNDDQYAKVKAINEKFETGKFNVKSDTSLTKGTSHKQMNTLRLEQEAQLKKVLTEAQWIKWTALKDGKRSYGKGKGGHGRGDKKHKE